MFNYTRTTSPSQDDDALIVSMLDQALAEEDLYIFPVADKWYLAEKSDDTFNILDEFPERRLAYRSGLDYVIEACVAAWDEGGDE